MNFTEIEPLPAVCRQSSIKCAIACTRRWFYRYRMGVRLRGTEYKEAATLGKVYHKLQQHGPGQEVEAKNWVTKQQRDLMDKEAKGEDLDGSAARLANQLTGLYKKAEVMAHIFWERFPQPPQFKVVGIEIKHSLEWNGMIIEGTLDKLLLNEQDGFIWIRDHKSTGRPLATLFGGLAWSLQGRLYRVLGEHYLAQLKVPFIGETMKVRGFILDGILIPGIKLCRTDEKNAKKWNCSVEDAYLRRVKEWYRNYEVKADLEGKKNTKVIDSKGILFTEPLFSIELQNVLIFMRSLFLRSPVPGRFDRDVTRTACFAYGKQCIYHDLCETDPGQWDSLFEIKYMMNKRVEEEKDDIGSV